MHYKQQGLSYCADPVPTLLTVDHAVLAKHQIRIGEHARCGLKIDASVLLLVRLVLVRLPFEAHDVIHNV